MPAQLLIRLFDAAYVLALAAWTGSLVLAILARGRDARADRHDSSSSQRLHVLGIVAGAVALPSLVAVPLSFPEYRGPWVAVRSLAILGGLFAMLYVANLPAVTAVRRRVVVLDVLVVILISGLLAAHMSRPAPRTAGLAELPAAERAGYDEELAGIIRDMETRYGYRAEGDGDDGPRTQPGGRVGEETIREIESYYREKRRRDDARAGSGRAGPASPPPRGPTGQSAGS
ncbi:hypothetical protein OJF2_58820 [Aquisphaera giovannonii]|uniref:Uncharacterized protein n=1 Tax=Aquisphaera giovannonii TaxID=406548 RepID=A0A5B9W9N5_9BACT|nr:hypothetical protein [Aquisphaera giovannonii]QEH37292.1 hypothetical protein OJF2_58820 [Aquisphaera giovannonii]